MVDGSHALVEMLKAYELDVILGCPVTPAFLYMKPCTMAQPSVRHVMARDERSASFMAYAYARLSHKPGLCECPSGAGPLYSVSGIAEAKASSVPVILITFDIPLLVKANRPSPNWIPKKLPSRPMRG